jgi:hypothetical protein
MQMEQIFHSTMCQWFRLSFIHRLEHEMYGIQAPPFFLQSYLKFCSKPKLHPFLCLKELEVKSSSEPAFQAHSLESLLGLLLPDLDGISTFARRRERQQLSLATFLEFRKIINRSFDRARRDQEPMVLGIKCKEQPICMATVSILTHLQDDCLHKEIRFKQIFDTECIVCDELYLFSPECFCDALPLFVSKDNAVELFVDCMILVVSTVILCVHLKLLSKTSKCPTMDRVGMRGAQDVRARRMDRRMYREGGAVEQPHGPGFIKDVALMVDEEKIGRLDQ